MGRRVQSRVSITEIFYTVLDFFGHESLMMPYAPEVDVRSQSLLRMAARDDFASQNLVSEAYGPENALTIMRKYNPDVIGKFDADQVHRAVYQGDEKMVAIGDFSKALYNLAGDPGDTSPYQDERRIQSLSKILDAYLELASTRNAGAFQRKISLKDDLIQQRLRDLGYLE